MSRIQWRYTITCSTLPLRYSLGTAWASGESSYPAVGLVQGFADLVLAYRRAPGLARLWTAGLDSPGLARLRAAGLDSPAEVARDASVMQLERYCDEIGVRNPVIHGQLTRFTLGAYIQNGEVCCGREIAESAGLDLDAPFLSVWEAFVVAMRDYTSTWHSWDRIRDSDLIITERGSTEPVDDTTRIRVLAELRAMP